MNILKLGLIMTAVFPSMSFAHSASTSHIHWPVGGVLYVGAILFLFLVKQLSAQYGLKTKLIFVPKTNRPRK